MVAAGSKRPSRSRIRCEVGKGLRKMRRCPSRGSCGSPTSDVVERSDGRRLGLEPAKMAARCDSLKRLPLSWAIARPRRAPPWRGRDRSSRKANAVWEKGVWRCTQGCGWPRRLRSGLRRRRSPPQPNRRITRANDQGCPGDRRVVSRPRSSYERHHSTYRSGWPTIRYAAPAKPSKPNGISTAAVSGITFRAGLGVGDAVLDSSGQSADGRDPDTATRAGDGRRRGRVRSTLRPTRSVHSSRPQ